MLLGYAQSLRCTSTPAKACAGSTDPGDKPTEEGNEMATVSRVNIFTPVNEIQNVERFAGRQDELQALVS
jgi:hypothetical protein